ncbi:hypothetical protein M0K77_002060 [Providencia rettgeri]
MKTRDSITQHQGDILKSRLCNLRKRAYTRYQAKGSYQPSGDYATNSTVNSKFDAANSNANGRVPNTRKVNGKPLNVDISLGAGDLGAYTKAESDTRIADAKAAGTNAQNTANAANTAATNANNVAFCLVVNVYSIFICSKEDSGKSSGKIHHCCLRGTLSNFRGAIKKPTEVGF